MNKKALAHTKAFGWLLAICMFFSQNAYACALCQAYAPTAHAFSSFYVEKNGENLALKNFNLKLVFSPNFSELTLANYDENGDKTLDKSELFEVKKALLDYILPRHFLTNLSYFNKGEEAKQIVLNHEGTKAEFKDKILSFDIDFSTYQPLGKEPTFALEMIDFEGFFNFIISDAKINAGLNLVQNLNANIGFFEVTNTQANPKIKPKANEIKTQKDKEIGLFKKLNNLIINSYNKIKAHFNDGGGLGGLFVLCFIYGVLHAAAPGHSKLLVASYFGSGKNSAKMALGIAMLIGVMHVISGLIIVIVLNKSLALSSVKLANTGTLIGGAAVLILAIFMLRKKLLNPHKNGCECAVCKAGAKLSPSTKAVPNLKFDKINISNLNLASLKPKQKEKISLPWGLIAAASLVPCPGVLLVFVLSFELANIAAAIISATGIALGMSLLLFISALSASTIRGLSQRLYGTVWLRMFEIASLLLMASIGIAMMSINLG